jgi:hypothetical protein
MQPDRFSWKSYDIATLLPSGWRQRILEVAQQKAVTKTLLPRSVTSREGDPDLAISVKTVNGALLKQELRHNVIYCGFNVGVGNGSGRSK